MIITIDGPTASGKSTVARKLAQTLGYYYVHSGLLFRALAYLLQQQYGYTEKQFARPRREDIDQIVDPKRFVYVYDDKHKERILFNAVDITSHLKRGDIDQLASVTSRDTYVREKFLQLQRSIAQSHDVIVDGRDAGSVVFPDADYKFYLTASEEERARRWRDQQAKYGIDRSLEDARAFIHERDQRDMKRTHAPLCVPTGGHIIDNTGKTAQETIAMLHAVVGR